MLKQVIYEQVINTEIAEGLSLCEREGYIPDKAEIVSPESSLILADYVTDIIKQQLNVVLEGSKYLQDKGVDILFVTLNKSAKDYSPTTMYNDYSINEELFHWQS